MKNTTFKILTAQPIDSQSGTPLWIEITTTHKFLFWSWTSREVIGKYTMDDSYGDLGDMPFFNRKEAEHKIKQLKRDEDNINN